MSTGAAAKWSIVAAALTALGLQGCSEPDRIDEQEVRAAADARLAANKRLPTCHDCDGGDGLVDETRRTEARAARACGGPVELIEGKTGLDPAEYRCRRRAR